MRVLFAVCTWAVLICGGCGVTKSSGIEQFWTDDYKIFEQVYGKTSDKSIYGTSLPASISYGGEKKALEKKERYPLTYDLDDEAITDFNDQYNSLVAKQLKSLSKKKPATSTINFISYSDFKPISQSNDPETYNYLKHLEDLDKEKHIEYPKPFGGFKPYLDPVGSNPEESDAYKSIQDILDAHEANKANSFKPNDEENVKYLTYDESKKKKPPRARVNKSRCANGRCRKRPHARVRSRPYIRRVKHRVIKY